MTILFFLLKYYAGTSCVLKFYLWVKVPKNLQALGSVDWVNSSVDNFDRESSKAEFLIYFSNPKQLC